MPRHVPTDPYDLRQAEQATLFHIRMSAGYPCYCGHPQGFHWDTDDGTNIGKCEHADCACEAFELDDFAVARLHAEVAAGSMTPSTGQSPAVLDALRELNGSPDDLNRT